MVNIMLTAPVATMFARAPEIAVPGVLEDLLGIIEDHVDSAPLLKHGQHHAEKQHLRQPGIEQFPEIDPLGFIGQRAFDLGHGGRGIAFAPDAAQDVASGLASRRRLSSQRGLSGTKNMPRKKRADGTAVRPNIHRQHVVPYQESRMNSASVAASGMLPRPRSQLVIWASKHAADDRELIDGNQPAAHSRRRNFGDIHRR